MLIWKDELFIDNSLAICLVPQPRHQPALLGGGSESKVTAYLYSTSATGRDPRSGCFCNRWTVCTKVFRDPLGTRARNRKPSELNLESMRAVNVDSINHLQRFWHVSAHWPFSYPSGSREQPHSDSEPVLMALGKVSDLPYRHKSSKQKTQVRRICCFHH